MHDNEDEVLSLKCGDEDSYGKQMNQLKSKIFQKAKENINDAQLKQKQYYDNKRGRRKVLYIMVKNLWYKLVTCKFGSSSLYTYYSYRNCSQECLFC